MKYAVLVARILLGAMFLFSGLNLVLMFMKIPQTVGDAGTLQGLLMGHGWMKFVGCLMVVSGVLLLVGRFVPLALTLLAPVLVNILLYHLLMGAPGIIPGIVLTVLEIFLILAYWRSFAPLLAPDPKFDSSKL